MTFRNVPGVGVYARKEFDRNLVSQSVFTYVTTRQVVSSVIAAATSPFGKFSPFDFKLDSIDSSNTESIKCIDREISMRSKLIIQFVRENFIGLLNNPLLKEELIKLFEKMPSVKKIIKVAVSPLLAVSNYVVCGNIGLLDFPSSYIYVADDSEISFSDAITCAANKIKKFEQIHRDQTLTSVSRDGFRLTSNCLLTPIRKIFKQEILSQVDKLPSVSEFDLSIQLLMHLGALKPDVLWLDSKTPNTHLVLSECKRLGEWLQNYFDHLYVELDGKKVYLPAKIMNKLDNNPLGQSHDRPVIDLSSKRLFYTESGAILEAREKYSGKRVFFAPVKREISSLYSKGFCNLHYSNLGEIECYGAYLDGYDMPFAYSSYGGINYNYTKEMLEYMGFSPDKIIESSRAWNAIWAPENTMSVLFAYSHDRLKEKINGLEGIITSINPNLGFSASAFRGVHFEVASLKPTIFSYQIDDNGKVTFLPKSQIARSLGVSVDKLKSSPHYTENNIPFLPTVEYLYLYSKENRKKLLSMPIYNVSYRDYLYNR